MLALLQQCQWVALPKLLFALGIKLLSCEMGDRQAGLTKQREEKFFGTKKNQEKGEGSDNSFGLSHLNFEAPVASVH